MPKPKKEKKEGEDDDLPMSGTLLTIDGRTCTGICTTNALPGMPGAPDPPADAALGQPDYGPGADVEEGMPDDGSGGGAAGPPAQINTGKPVKCDATGQDKAVSGPTGKAFRVDCPKNCDKAAGGSVIGSMIYNDESSICKAAIHAGFLIAADGGEFIVVIANGEEKYESAFQNGIQSIGYGASARAITFKAAPKIVSISCDTNGQEAMFGGEVGTNYAVICPKDCTFESHEVYGTDVYADESKICQAAIHAGLMTD